jgi:hypothetical protein
VSADICGGITALILVFETCPSPSSRCAARFNPRMPTAVAPLFEDGGDMMQDGGAEYDDATLRGSGDATKGFIDGDLVELFADLPRLTQV